MLTDAVLTDVLNASVRTDGCFADGHPGGLMDALLTVTSILAMNFYKSLIAF